MEVWQWLALQAAPIAEELLFKILLHCCTVKAACWQPQQTSKLWCYVYMPQIRTISRVGRIRGSSDICKRSKDKSWSSSFIHWERYSACNSDTPWHKKKRQFVPNQLLHLLGLFRKRVSSHTWRTTNCDARVRIHICSSKANANKREFNLHGISLYQRD